MYRVTPPPQKNLRNVATCFVIMSYCHVDVFVVVVLLKTNNVAMIMGEHLSRKLLNVVALLRARNSPETTYRQPNLLSTFSQPTLILTCQLIPSYQVRAMLTKIVTLKTIRLK